MIVPSTLNTTLTAVAGLRVGHHTDRRALTGCTVILCPGGATGGVCVRGGAPGTRETDALRPGTVTPSVHGVVLTGGSAFGLDAAGGVMRYLEEIGAGFPTPAGLVPIVPAAVVYDLGIGDPTVRPTAEDGYTAAMDATDDPVAEGCVGAGTGVTAGKALGIGQAVKSGLGTAAVTALDGTVVAALAVVNAFGEVVEPNSGVVLAGPRDAEGFMPTIDAMQQRAPGFQTPVQNTTLVVVATDATLTKEQANALAGMADDGIARAVRPAHTAVDGDLVFALATGRRQTTLTTSTLGALAADVVARAIVRAVFFASPAAGLPSARELAAQRLVEQE